MLHIIEVTDGSGALQEAVWLQRAETVHRQLRPHLRTDYAEQMKAVFAGGARMAVAVEDDRPQVVGVAVWRLLLKTSSGLELYVDDLVTDERCRSRGVGAGLLRWLERRARSEKCDTFALDSGTQRHQAHRFYFRERMTIAAYHFSRTL
jgi:GNAT superfamily N-acetyltransferase